MSSRPLLRPEQVLIDGDMSDAELLSLPSIIQMISQVSYAVSWEGSTPIGVINIQVSNDYSTNPDGSVKNEGIWTNLVLSINGSLIEDIPVTGDSSNGFINISNIAAYAIRLRYGKTSGTGLLQATISAKVS